MSAKDDCYRLIQQVVVAQAKGRCLNPACKRQATVGHHLFKRDRLATAFRPDCVVAVCHECHVSWCHAQPAKVRMFMFRKIGNERYYELERLSNSRAKESEFDFNGTREELKWILK